MRKLALFSVTNKDGIGSLARALIAQGHEIVATGSTLKHLISEGVAATDVSALTGEPERFDGRVKTLHHKIYGALLMRSNGKDEKEWPFDYRISAVVCNFYPFEEKAPLCENLDEVVEWIDIGGPTMVRAAAKSFRDVWVFTHPSQYARYIASIEEEWPRLRERFALDAFELIADLDNSIHDHLLQRNLGGSPDHKLRYGENPQQEAWYVPNRRAALKFWGEWSFNNLRDAEAALRFVRPFHEGPAVAVVKHQTLCGAAAGLEGASPDDVFNWAWEGDTNSRFGGILAFNFVPTVAITELLEKKFVEVLLVPAGDEARRWADALHARKPRVRIVQADLAQLRGRPSREVFTGYLGKLSQTSDSVPMESVGYDPAKLQNAFGQWAAACSKSNSMILTGWDDKKAVAYLAGTGQGQPNRVEALKLLALPRAKDFAERMNVKLSDMTCFSDAFLPFADSVDVLADAGVKRLVQPGGSKNDEDVKAKAKERGVQMTITGDRHFWH